MPGRNWIVAVLMLGLGVFLPRVSTAATLESLLSPGKLSRAHAKYEGECSQCHDRSDRNRQAQLCADCHKDIAADLKAGRGLHGRRAGGGIQCSACHSEHLGLDARIVNLLPAQFDHGQTDFALDGRHSGVACEGCHHVGKRFSEAPGRCVDCHRSQEPHAGTLGTDCAACHATRGWSEVDFDHAKTRFALDGTHGRVPCAACHAGNRWKETPRRCVACHAPDDVHRTRRGIACGECHKTSTWDADRFDHEKETGFALRDAHSRAACQSCHRSGRYEDKLPKDCAGCHATSDSHAGRLGARCETCHAETRWTETRFDHQRDTTFALVGLHAKLQCHACHTAPVATQKLGSECASCHRKDDVHRAALGQDCAACHSPEAWKKDVVFDHDLTRFPLVGLHAAVSCGQCHATRDYARTPAECRDCHASRDVHQGGLGEKCARCHTPNDWRVWDFDHRRETGYSLEGAHAKAQCAACHREPASRVKLSRDCGACHQQDDVHLGQFGRQCSRCHDTSSFRRARMRQ
jgi:hypothetical protein